MSRPTTSDTIVGGDTDKLRLKARFKSFLAQHVAPYDEPCTHTSMNGVQDGVDGSTGRYYFGEDELEQLEEHLSHDGVRNMKWCIQESFPLVSMFYVDFDDGNAKFPLSEKLVVAEALQSFEKMFEKGSYDPKDRDILHNSLTPTKYRILFFDVCVEKKTAQLLAKDMLTRHPEWKGVLDTNYTGLRLMGNLKFNKKTKTFVNSYYAVNDDWEELNHAPVWKKYRLRRDLDDITPVKDSVREELNTAKKSKDKARPKRVARKPAEDTLKEVEALLPMLSEERWTEYELWLKIGMALHSTGDEFLELWDEWSSRYDGYEDDCCLDKWKSFNCKVQAANKDSITLGSLHHWAKTDSPKEYAKFVATRVAEEKRSAILAVSPNTACAVSSSNKTITYDEPWVKKLSSKSNILLKSALGTGKTQQIAKELETLGPNAKVLVVSPRRKFAESISKRLGIPCYLKMKPAQIAGAPRLVLSMESLHQLDDDNLEFDLVVGDEIESCLTQFCSKVTMGDRIDANLSHFQTIMKNCKRFIFADAFLSQRTIEVCDRLELAYTLVVNTRLPTPRRCIEFEMVKEDEKSHKYVATPLFNEMLRLLKDKKRLFFVSGSKAKADEFEAVVKSALPQLKYRYYSSAANDYAKDFVDVNKTWSEFPLIITTTTITVGINFDQKGVFDVICLYGVSSGATPRDLFQASMRIRHLNANLLLYSIYPLQRRIGPLTPEKIKQEIFTKNDHLLASTLSLCGQQLQLKEVPWVTANYVYTQLEKNVSSELYRQLFLAYLKCCGYTELKKQSDETPLEIDDVPAVAYAEIDEIDEEDTNTLKGKVDRGESTMQEKLKLNKYYWNLNFRESGHHNRQIEDLYNARYVAGVRQITHQMRNIRIEKKQANDQETRQRLLENQQDRNMCYTSKTPLQLVTADQ